MIGWSIPPPTPPPPPVFRDGRVVWVHNWGAVRPHTIVKRRRRGVEFYQILHRIADLLKPKVRRLFIESVEQVQNALPLEEIEKILRGPNPLAALELIPLEKFENLGKLARILQAGAVRSGQAAAKPLADLLGIRIEFNPDNPYARHWARQRSSRLIVEVSEGTKESIRELIASQYQLGLDAPVLTRLIRDVVGLRQDQVGFIEHYRERLLEDGVVGEKLQNLVHDYTIAQHRWRSETIARTETIDSTSKGQDFLWQEKVREGLLDPALFREEWVVTPDDDTCEVCLAIPEDERNQDVPIGGQFVIVLANGDEIHKDGPTAHPNCRCCKTLRRID